MLQIITEVRHLLMRGHKLSGAMWRPTGMKDQRRGAVEVLLVVAMLTSLPAMGSQEAPPAKEKPRGKLASKSKSGKGSPKKTRPPKTTQSPSVGGVGGLDDLEAKVLLNQRSFVQIPAGEFLMGSENGNDDEKPVHRVRISHSFEMAKYEVTQAEWQALMDDNPSHFKGAKLPVERISWNDAQYFIKKLNAQNDGYTYRLPTEAEWEYACRAGRTGDYAGNLNAMAWYDRNSRGRTHPVGTKQPNAWGLYDMLGNVSEWCQDEYDKEYYMQSPSVDPQGPVSGLSRVYRGSAWGNPAGAVRSTMRWTYTSNGGSDLWGFRLVRTPRETVFTH